MPSYETPQRRKATRITDDVFAAVIRDYLACPKFNGYSAATRKLWGNELRFASHPEYLGGLSIYEIRPALVQAFLDAISNRPGKQAASQAALRAVEKWAIVRDRLPHHIMTGTELVECEDSGHVPWSDAQVEQAEVHCRPDLAMMVTLAANTGQRGSDLIKMRWSDLEAVEGYPGINVTQLKTKKQIWVPLTQALQNAMAAWERRPGFILLTRQGKPWTRNALTHAWSHERATNRALAAHRELDLAIHGLRATAVVRLRRRGITTAQIADVVGMSEDMVARYCRFSKQRENALAAVLMFDRTSGEHSPEQTKKSAPKNGS